MRVILIYNKKTINQFYFIRKKCMKLCHFIYSNINLFKTTERYINKMKCAVVSVSDKTNLNIIGDYLVNNQFIIISSGGTYRALTNLYPDYNNIRKVEEVTGFPEILGGRVKTLHPRIHGGILASSSVTEHINEINEKDILKIDMVVVNLYPFQNAVKQNSKIENAIENIDIGGHTLIRAAAKNFRDVLVVSNPSDYKYITESWLNDGLNSEELRRVYANKAWEHITEYDMAISHYFNPSITYRNYRIQKKLKYGCNPHQSRSGIHTINGDNVPFDILNGTPGYINILDAVNSWQLVCELGSTLNTVAAASFKHTSPAGVGVGTIIDSDNSTVANDLSTQLRRTYFLNEETSYSPTTIAYLRARNSDPMSSFGDFIAIYGTVDEELALLIKREVSDGIIALDYTEDAMSILKGKKRGKYIILKGTPITNEFLQEYREMGGFCLSQTPNCAVSTMNYLSDIVTTTNTLSELDKINLVVANTSLKYAQSNSVAYAYDGQLVGLGAGQQSRVDCVKLAGRKTDIWFLRSHPKVLSLHSKFVPKTKRQTKVNACIRYIEGDFTPIEKTHWDQLFIEPIEPLTEEEKRDYLSTLQNVALASDAFFPFRDNIDHCSKRGVSCIVQPGGSIADPQIIEACDEYNITMAFSGTRVFTH